MSFFGVPGLGGNPFSTPVGQRIEIATDENLPSENWELNMEICDLINNTDEGPRDAVKAIRKRLQQNAGKNYTVVMYTLTVLETCVKNCGKRFHVLVCSKDFVQDLVKLIGPKNDPPTVVQEKVLSLIQSWADAFAGQPELSGVVAVVCDLRAKGIEFPPTDLDTMAPIHTPHRTVTEPCAEVVPPASQIPNAAGDSIAVNPNVPVPVPINAPLAPEQIGKLQSELDVVQNNMAVLSEMLSELTPGKEDSSDLELLQELHSTCKAMQIRLVELIGKLANDELTAELLRINDEMNNIFLRYARYEKNREAGNRNTPSALLGAALGVASPTKIEDAQESLIDLSDGPSTASNLEDEFAALSVRNGSKDLKLSQIASVPAQKGPIEKDDEFDMFAQSRNVTYESSKTGGSTYKDNLEPDQVSGGLSSLANTRTQPPTVPGARENIPEESVTSSEFERFLAERAAAAEALPTNPNQPSPNRQPQQRRTKDDDANLFAL
ncbi:TOM1-like protein 2 isoform X2 [Chrysoperla carnea]|uniref:TOM1-like protein 2 isoform X2 n=1 Tax=Chrysoperla carnea TaxID=189513 RepID=UPI001D0981B6|nr:TOM1-like protein 2 isoform X2 [Chrysoperla carnea]